MGWSSRVSLPDNLRRRRRLETREEEEAVVVMPRNNSRRGQERDTFNAVSDCDYFIWTDGCSVGCTGRVVGRSNWNTVYTSHTNIAHLLMSHRTIQIIASQPTHNFKNVTAITVLKLARSERRDGPWWLMVSTDDVLLIILISLSLGDLQKLIISLQHIEVVRHTI